MLKNTAHDDDIRRISKLTRMSINTLMEQLDRDLTAQSHLSRCRRRHNIWDVSLPSKVCPICWRKKDIQALPRYWGEPWRLTCQNHDVFLESVEYDNQNQIGVFCYSRQKFSIKNRAGDVNNAKPNILVKQFEVDCRTISSNPDIPSPVKKVIYWMDVLLIDQSPIFEPNLLSWWMLQLNRTNEEKVVSIDPHKPIAPVIDELSVSLKTVTVNLIYSLLSRDASIISQLYAALYSVNSPLRHTIPFIELEHFKEYPFDLLVLGVRKDMWRPMITFLQKTKNSIWEQWAASTYRLEAFQ